MASYLVAGVERGEEHEGAGAGHVERAVLRVQQLRPQEPAGGHGGSGGAHGWHGTAAPSTRPSSTQRPSSPHHALGDAGAQ